MAQFHAYGGQAPPAAAYGGAQPPAAAQFDQQPWFTNVESEGDALGTPRASDANYGNYASGGGWAGGFSTTAPQNSFGYSPASPPDEPPLLEELGIDFSEILAKTKLVLTPSVREVDASLVDETDLAGPIVFVFLLGGTLVLHGKLHFGHLYGFGLSSCVSMYTLLNLMCAEAESIDFASVASFLGYCLLPVVFLAAAALVVAPTSVTGTTLAALAVFGSTCTSTRLFE
eukprot:CAMPEP_0119264094 /NCGR_PEP_ID=MMETSP1329-20130426/3282_1 /TAXON_ID=114041 /ORGANISM="Genus nov. species nov., Strain RCC1024" /LENGTH=228 /DNA_ID=CAMNT_0007263837 /DNA_START=265 /DNA_END=948 /DNA_ORIENTATION=+